MRAVATRRILPRQVNGDDAADFADHPAFIDAAACRGNVGSAAEGGPSAPATSVVCRTSATFDCPGIARPRAAESHLWARTWPAAGRSSMNSPIQGILVAAKHQTVCGYRPGIRPAALSLIPSSARKRSRWRQRTLQRFDGWVADVAATGRSIHSTWPWGEARPQTCGAG